MAEPERFALDLEQQHKKEHEGRLRSLRGAIKRFASEPQRLGLTVDYDAATDTLFAYAGTEPRSSVTVHLADHVYVRLDESGDITGFEVLDFVKNIGTNSHPRVVFAEFYPAVVHFQMLFLPPMSVASAAAAKDIEQISSAA
jgi:hypothetical protein